MRTPKDGTRPRRKLAASHKQYATKHFPTKAALLPPLLAACAEEHEARHGRPWDATTFGLSMEAVKRRVPEAKAVRLAKALEAAVVNADKALAAVQTAVDEVSAHCDESLGTLRSGLYAQRRLERLARSGLLKALADELKGTERGYVRMLDLAWVIWWLDHPAHQFNGHGYERGLDDRDVAIIYLLFTSGADLQFGEEKGDTISSAIHQFQKRVNAARKRMREEALVDRGK